LKKTGEKVCQSIDKCIRLVYIESVEQKHLIEALERKREENRWSDSQMAEKLGCGRTTYLETRRGTMPVGMSVLRGVARSFPELKDALFSFLASSLDSSSS